MKKLAVLVIILTSIISLPCISNAGKKDNVVTLNMLDTKLERHEGTEWDAFTIDENKVEFTKTKVDKYDTFFREVAIIKGTMTELNYVLEKMEILEANKGVGILILREFGKPVLPTMEERIPGLIDQAKTFKPADDFTGMKKTKIPGVASGLTKSIGTLNSAMQDIPKILEAMNIYLQDEESDE